MHEISETLAVAFRSAVTKQRPQPSIADLEALRSSLDRVLQSASLVGPAVREITLRAELAALFHGVLDTAAAEPPRHR